MEIVGDEKLFFLLSFFFFAIGFWNDWGFVIS